MWIFILGDFIKVYVNVHLYPYHHQDTCSSIFICTLVHHLITLLLSFITSYKGSHHKKKTEKFGKNSLMGGRGKIFFKKVPISIWEHRNPGGGGSQFFKNVPISIILQLFCNITFIRNVWKSKMSEFDPKGGSAIFKNVWNLKKS